MFDTMRRLHPRGAANRGVSVDAEGAMLGPNCVLVDRCPPGYRVIEQRTAASLQKSLLGADRESDWLFQQCGRIAEALNRGELALAQIYGLRIPINDLDEGQLTRVAAISSLFRVGYDPNEPRVPKGDPRGGQWTSEGAGGGGEGGDGSAADGAAAASGDGGAATPGAAGGGDAAFAPSSGAGGDHGDGGPPAPRDEPAPDARGQDAGDRPSMEYRFVPVSPDEAGTSESSTGSPASHDSGADTTVPNLPTGSVPIAATLADLEATVSLLGSLPSITESALAQLASRLSGATVIFSILFIPSNGGVVVEGRVAGAPGLSFRYDRDTGVLRVFQDVGSLGRASIVEAHVGLDGRLYDRDGRVVARPLPDGAVIVDLDTLPGYRSQSQTSVRPQAAADTTALARSEPKLCPDPTPDQPGAPRDNLYQQYVSTLINGTPLPPGLAVALWNPTSGKFVYFDDCRLSDGTMIDAKGFGYLEMLQKGSERYPWLGVQEKIIDQADRQLRAAQGRAIEWHFASQKVADYVRALFLGENIPITIVYTPMPGMQR